MCQLILTISFWQLLDAPHGTDRHHQNASLHTPHLHLYVVRGWYPGDHYQENCGPLRSYDINRKGLYTSGCSGACGCHKQNFRIITLLQTCYKRVANWQISTLFSTDSPRFKGQKKNPRNVMFLRFICIFIFSTIISLITKINVWRTAEHDGQPWDRTLSDHTFPFSIFRGF